MTEESPLAQAMPRSWLFVPGNRPDMMAKSERSGADVVILDLEDAVLPAEKRPAREKVRRYLSERGVRPSHGETPLVFVRVNNTSRASVEADLDTVVRAELDGVCLPKASSVGDVEHAVSVLTDLEGRAAMEAGGVKLLPIVETARGLVRAEEIAAASPRVVALAFGAEDFIADMGIERATAGAAIGYARWTVALAARAGGVQAVDTVYTAFRDDEGLAADTLEAKRLGFTGKLLIHPRQVELVHRAFAPTADEVARARRILEAVDAARREGTGVTVVDGRMVDEPVVAQARAMLARGRLTPNPSPLRWRGE